MHRTHPEPDDARDDRWARLAGVLLMVLVLVVAGLLSALTAMRFAIRGQEVEVPDLTGTTQVEAARILSERGLELRLSGRRFNSTVGKDRILDQIPAPGSRLKLERGVKVVLSLGERQFSVPDVEGASLRATQLMLTQRGLSVGNTLYAHTEAGEASTIVHQSPPAGDIGGSDPAVNVLVSARSSRRVLCHARSYRSTTRRSGRTGSKRGVPARRGDLRRAPWNRAWPHRPTTASRRFQAVGLRLHSSGSESVTVRIAPSILSANFATLAEEIRVVEEAGGALHPRGRDGRALRAKYHDRAAGRLLDSQGDEPAAGCSLDDYGAGSLHPGLRRGRGEHRYGSCRGGNAPGSHYRIHSRPQRPGGTLP